MLNKNKIQPTAAGQAEKNLSRKQAALLKRWHAGPPVAKGRGRALKEIGTKILNLRVSRDSIERVIQQLVLEFNEVLEEQQPVGQRKGART